MGGTTTITGFLKTGNNNTLDVIGSVQGVNAVLDVNGGTLQSRHGPGIWPAFTVGNAANSAFMTIHNNGTNQALVVLAGQLGIANGATGVGVVTMTSGSMALGGNGASIGGNNCFGILNMAGGVISNTGWSYISGGGFNTSTGSGMINLTGGTLQSGNVYNGQLSTGYVNVNGGTFNVSGDFYIGRSNGSPQALHGSGWLNLISGTLTANQVQGSLTPTVGYLNFNGGTLAKNNAGGATFISLLSEATIWPRGAIIQSDAGMDARINQPLVTPTGLGVGTITLSNVGSGYLDTPFVFFVDGGGTGAHRR